jgi:hypothetical protein
MRTYLCFLDLDGVLTSSRVHTAQSGSYPIWSQFDPVAVQFFNYIHDTYAVEFCLMSTWKNGLDVKDSIIEHWIRATFANAGFRGTFASPWKTNPENTLDTNRYKRGDEVKHYLETYGSDVEDFILFDDNRYNFNEALGVKRLVLTDSENGLLHQHMLVAKSMMGTWNRRSTNK